MTRWVWAPLAVCAISMVGCPGPQPPDHVAEGIFGRMGAVLPRATADQAATFLRGKSVAERRWTPALGLGPDFNVTSCTSCHEKPVRGGGGARYRNFLLVAKRLPDGSVVNTGVNGVQPQYTLDPEGRRHTDDGTNMSALRNAIPFFGVGLLAMVPESEITKRADPNDANHDGISGRVNIDRGFVSRFGRKAQTASIEGFIRGPFENHLGITSNPLPPELKAQLPVPSAADLASATASLSVALEGDVEGTRAEQASAPDMPLTDDDAAPDPELSQQDLFDLVSWAMLLAAPQPDPPTPETEEGRALFEQAGCDDCHVEALKSPIGLIPAYTDLLLHDMGPGLADGFQFKLATGSEFRTQPLWGVAATGPYLHDGRADTLDEAIRWHGGEGQVARDAYAAMTDDQRAKIIAFLDSLGGASQKTDGLLPPGAPVPDVGEYGGPARPLSNDEMALFEKGRAVFDLDMRADEGLGPEFNGDACRACHFDPVIGGSGPNGVDVTRQGIFDSAGNFVMPPHGTMLHKEQLDPTRTMPDPMCNFFELRQAPPLFGLGLIDQIPDADIMARADPEDANGDGISGRPDVLPDGRIGREGWKADVPNVHEFTRDGLTNEEGITVPAEDGYTFGKTSDGDDAPDPEISPGPFHALVFFMENLGPPPRTRTDPAMEDAGQAIFSGLGCADCHVPDQTTADGVVFHPYTDVLLHDVHIDGEVSVASADAEWYEFRTAPLWGLAKSAPYMHDGRSTTIEDAIARHGSEALASRTAYEALSAEQRAELIAFLKSL